MRDAVNIQAVQLVATGLRELRDKVVFVGGAIISLYADDPGADIPRPTADIDLVIALSGYGALAHLEARLAELGFHHSPEDDIICRYRHQGVAAVLVAAITGAGAMLPIAGGVEGTPVQELVISFLLITLSLAMVAVSLPVLVGLWKGHSRAASLTT